MGLFSAKWEHRCRCYLGLETVGELILSEGMT